MVCNLHEFSVPQVITETVIHSNPNSPLTSNGLKMPSVSETLTNPSAPQMHPFGPADSIYLPSAIRKCISFLLFAHHVRHLGRAHLFGLVSTAGSGPVHSLPFRLNVTSARSMVPGLNNGCCLCRCCNNLNTLASESVCECLTEWMTFSCVHHYPEDSPVSDFIHFHEAI